MSATGEGRIRLSPTLEDQNLAANPVVADDREPAVHACVFSPQISGLLQHRVEIMVEARAMVP